MITFQISGYLTEFTGGRAEIQMDVAPDTVAEALGQLWKAHAGLRDRVLTEQGDVRPHVNVFVNSEVVRRDHVLDTGITGDVEICIMPAVSGGSVARPRTGLPLINSTELRYVLLSLAVSILLFIGLFFICQFAGRYSWQHPESLFGGLGFILWALLTLPFLGVDQPPAWLLVVTVVFDVWCLFLAVYLLTRIWRHQRRVKSLPTGSLLTTIRPGTNNQS
jgi:sulfur-carrier protein